MHLSVFSTRQRRERAKERALSEIRSLCVWMCTRGFRLSSTALTSRVAAGYWPASDHQSHRLAGQNHSAESPARIDSWSPVERSLERLRIHSLVRKNPTNKSNYFCFWSKGRCLIARASQATIRDRILDIIVLLLAIGYFSGFVNYFLAVSDWSSAGLCVCKTQPIGAAMCTEHN